MSTFYSIKDYVDSLIHGGPGSGRYPKGSGENPFQHEKGAFKGKKVDAGKWFKQDIKSGKDKAPMSRAEKATREFGRAVDEASNLAGRMGNMQRRKANAGSIAKNLSDKELSDAIRRMRLEREYNSLAYNDIATGYDAVQDVLSAVGNVAGIAASAATVASVIYGIKHHGK